MYTRCPSCSCTFRVTAAVLQMAEGEVRCGSCSVVFNALHTLVDDWSGADFETPGDGQLSLPDASATDAGPAPAAKADTALEFNVPEQEWSRIFIAPEAAPPSPDQRDPDLGEEFEAFRVSVQPMTADDTAEHARPPLRQDRPRSLEEETADTDTWQRFLREAEPGEAEDGDPPYVIGEDDADRGRHPDILRRELRPDAVRLYPDMDLQPPAGAARQTEADPGGGDVVEVGDGLENSPDDGAKPAAATPDTILDWGPPPAFGTTGQPTTRRTWPWLAGSVVAALALTAQILHYNRDMLAANPAYGRIVQGVYRQIGWPLYPAWPLDAYDIRSAKAIAESSAGGDLDIVAEIAVTGRQPVGLPVVRVVLRDRWSNPVATGAFDSGHYLTEPSAARPLYAPGTLIPVQISLKDPGSAAQGYELDVCLPNRHFGLQCKTARDPFRP